MESSTAKSTCHAFTVSQCKASVKACHVCLSHTQIYRDSQWHQRITRWCRQAVRNFFCLKLACCLPCPQAQKCKEKIIRGKLAGMRQMDELTEKERWTEGRREERRGGGGGAGTEGRGLQNEEEGGRRRGIRGEILSHPFSSFHAMLLLLFCLIHKQTEKPCKTKTPEACLPAQLPACLPALPSLPFSASHVLPPALSHAMAKKCQSHAAACRQCKIFSLPLLFQLYTGKKLGTQAPSSHRIERERDIHAMPCLCRVTAEERLWHV